ncbi:MAG: hypothetical protein ACOY93_08435 [Bacillota bacterium]
MPRGNLWPIAGFVGVLVLTVVSLLLYRESASEYPDPWNHINAAATILALAGSLGVPVRWRSTWRETVWYAATAAVVAGGMVYPLLRFSLGWV